MTTRTPAFDRYNCREWRLYWRNVPQPDLYYTREDAEAAARRIAFLCCEPVASFRVKRQGMEDRENYDIRAA